MEPTAKPPRGEAATPGEPASPAPAGPGELVDDLLSVGEVRRRATAGAFLLSLRGLGIRLIALAANLVIARLLAPADVGLVAIGATLVTFGDFIATAGMGASLIRHPRPPEPADLRSVVGFQFLVTGTLAVAVAVIAAPLGLGGQLAAVMVASLPLFAFRTPGVVMLERELRYGPLVVVELLDALVYAAWAVTTVALGWGVWGLATAVIARAVIGTVVLIRLSPVGVVAPSLDFGRLRPILGFGARFQAVGVVNLVRDQGFNIAIAAIAGVTVLGLWTLAYRVLQTLLLVFQGLWRVSYPAMARLMEAGENPRPIIERGVGIVALGSGLFLAPLAASGPALIPAALGARWADAADILPAACLGLMIVGPVSVSVAGYLYAEGDAGTPLRGALLHTAAQYVVAFALLPSLRGWALGLAGLAAGIVEAVVLGRAASRSSGARVVPPLLVPLLASCAAAGGGWALATTGHPTLPRAAAAAAVSAAVYLAIVGTLRPRLVADTAGLIRRAVRSR
jgi:O-antigen/teichoic acid export membrane protein